MLERDEAGDYWLVTPVERARISVDDAPFVAVAMDVEGEGRSQSLLFRTNIDENVAAGPEHALTFRTRPDVNELAPYLSLDGGLEALLARAVYYDLVERAVEKEIDGQIVLGVWSGGHVFFRSLRCRDLGSPPDAHQDHRAARC